MLGHRHQVIGAAYARRSARRGSQSRLYCLWRAQRVLRHVRSRDRAAVLHNDHAPVDRRDRPARGENPDDIDARLACVSVLSLGSRNKGDDDAEVGYFAVRAALARALPTLADRALPPALAGFIAVIAERCGIVVSEMVIAEAVPIVGAVG